MALDVGLGYDVEAELVAQVEERGVVRIVRRPDGGDVVRSHRDQVGTYVGHGDRLATLGMMVVAVDAEDPDRTAVHEQLPVANLDVVMPTCCVST